MAEPSDSDNPNKLPAVANTARVFISYASRDGAVAEKVRGALEGAGLPCWIAPRDVRPGESYAAAIVDAISACRMMVLVLSKSAIESSHVLREVERASSKNRPVLAVRLDTTQLPSEFEYFLSATQWLDACAGPVEPIFPALIESVRGRAAASTSGSAGPPPATPPDVARGADIPAAHASEYGYGLPFKIPFLERLKRRHVGRVAILYAVLCYLILEPFSMFLHVLALPEWTGRALVMLMVFGFPAVLIFAWVYEFTPHGIKSATEINSSQSSRKLVGRRLDFAIIIVLVLALGYFAADKFWLSKRLLTPEQPATAATAVVSDKSIAVLPFTDMSEKKNQEYFADGIAEQVLELLARIPGLKVIGRTSSFQFRGTTLEVPSIGARLGVAHLLEGSVQRSGDTVRVTAQLISTKDGSHEWSDTYEGKFDDVLKVQDAIASGLARALEIAVGDVQIPVSHRINAAAYDLFLKAMHAFDPFTEEGCQEAIGLFTQSLQLDPKFAPAAVGIAWAYDDIGQNGWLPTELAYGRARASALRALELDPTQGAAHTVLADVHLVYDWDWAAAQREIDAAFFSGGRTSAGLAVAARIAAATDPASEKAARLLHEAIALDPLNAEAQIVLGYWVYARTGRFSEGARWIRRGLEISPHWGTGHYFLAIDLLMDGHIDEAIESAKAERPDDGRFLALAAIYHAKHRSADSDAFLAKAIATNGDSWASAIAMAYAWRGEADKAMQWLERAYTQHDEQLYMIKGEPQLRNLEKDARYKDFLRKMNLPE
jgi:adenylate cyclase